MKRIGMIGGDLRNKYLADMCKKVGYDVFTYGLYEDESETLESLLMKSECIICGTPFSRDNLTIQAPFAKNEIVIEKILPFLSKEKIFFAGGISDKMKQSFQNLQIKYYDFLEDERTTILNVIPTVEGAISLAIQKTDFTLYDSYILVLGYGRIGKYLGRILKASGAKVSVAARKESDLTWIHIDGNKPVSYENLDLKLSDFDLIFNTVPASILNEDRIKLLKESCQIIDLASKPGGIDFESAKKYGIKAELALGLPGKVAPKSAAKYMFEFFEKCTK